MDGGLEGMCVGKFRARVSQTRGSRIRGGVCRSREYGEL